ncbi:phage major tail tube protein [Vibrio scophthalmi]|uniref:phage major tail tube protein n=1 Tax=Vibrio scophthalmi TaxID=45658 RepID=UPI0022838346|nr:phage major tail tube protein [Vibrio scophthalmi]MCY9802701.1 phage major tail tube protein [Vibrio scophthalmi]
MADRIRIRISALVESVPLMNEIMEFTPPDLKSKTANNEGGFFQSEDVVGFEALKWTLKVRGDHRAIQTALGRFFMSNAQVNVTEAGKHTDGVQYKEKYSMYGPITNIKKDAVKMGEKPSVTIEGTCKAYKLTDTGTVVHDINVDTGKAIVGGADLMSLAGI